MVMVPVMLQRTLELGEEKINEFDHSALRIIFLSGSALPAAVAKRALKAFGPVIYNLYGSTEISYATIATPEDLQDDPVLGGQGRARLGGQDLRRRRQGAPGGRERAHLRRQPLAVRGLHRRRDSKDEIDGLIASGDVGHFDEKGRLYIDGRDDEMIVSGGENVFPAEVEELLASHEKIEEAAVIGVEDEKFGQRLKAFVVQRGDGLSEDDVKEYVKENLANYKVPREVSFVDELPRNATGKVLKRELAEQDEESGEGDSESSDSKDKESAARTAGARTAEARTARARTAGARTAEVRTVPRARRRRTTTARPSRTSDDAESGEKQEEKAAS